jgi:hypothetical protein
MLPQKTKNEEKKTNKRQTKQKREGRKNTKEARATLFTRQIAKTNKQINVRQSKRENVE